MYYNHINVSLAHSGDAAVSYSLTHRDRTFCTMNSLLPTQTCQTFCKKNVEALEELSCWCHGCVLHGNAIFYRHLSVNVLFDNIVHIFYVCPGVFASLAPPGGRTVCFCARCSFITEGLFHTARVTRCVPVQLDALPLTRTV